MNLEKIKNNLLEIYQIDYEVNNDTDDSIVVRPNDLDKGKGFYIHIEKGWKRIDGKVVFEDLSRKFVNALSNPPKDRIIKFVTILDNSRKNGFSSNIKINGSASTDIQELLGTDSIWDKFDLEVSKIYIEDNASMSDALMSLSEDIVGLMLSLMELVEKYENFSDVHSIGLPEGAMEKIAVNKYERNRINRKCCLDYYGYDCKVCEINFEKHYGSIGKNFIHVHHITPVSQLGPDYVIHPIDDLVPVCPNCHSMIHKKDPPFTIDEMKQVRDSE